MKNSIFVILAYFLIGLSCCKIKKKDYVSDDFFIQLGKVDQSGLNGVREFYEFKESVITYDNGDFRNINGSSVVEKKLTNKIDTNKLYSILDAILVKSISGNYTCERMDSTNMGDGNFVFFYYRKNSSLGKSFYILIDNCFYSDEFELLESFLNEELLKADFKSKVQLQKNLINGCRCKEFFWEKDFIEND
jgi:hypothetical protein